MQDSSSVDAPQPEAALPLGMPATRKLSNHELGLLVLILLTDTPRYGSDLAQAIETLSKGFYRPSPGMLYPVLAKLTEQRCLVKERRGRRKYYALTDEGKRYLTTRRDSGEQIYQRLQRAGQKLQRLHEVLSETTESPSQALPMAQELMTARMDLKAALYKTQHLSLEAQEEVLTILRDAAERIRACTQHHSN